MFDEKFWIASAFIVLLTIAIICGGKKLLIFIDGKIAAIKESVEASLRLKQEAENLLDAAKKKRDEASEYLHNTIAAAKIEAENIRRAAEVETAHEISAQIALTKKRIEQMEARAEAEILSAVIAQATIITAEYLTTNLDRVSHDKIIAHRINRLD